MKRGWGAALALSVWMGMTGSALAHELACERALGTDRVLEVWTYPASLEVTGRVFNALATDASVLQSHEDAAVTFDFAAALPVGVGVVVSDTQVATVSSYEGCLAAAAADGLVDHHIDEAFTVFWTFGQAQCTTRVTCCSSSVEGRCGAPPTATTEGGAP